MQRLEVISGNVAHPEFFRQFRLGETHMLKYIDFDRNPTSVNRVSGFIAHRRYDVTYG
jgi:hypothetical protein